MKARRWSGLALGLVMLSFLLLAPACDQGGGDNEDQYSQSKGLYRCQNCEEVLDWLHEMAIARMERIVDESNGQGYYDDDDWGDDDTAAANDDDTGGWFDDDAADDDMAADDDDSGDDEAADDDQSGDAGDDDDYTDTNTQEEGVDEPDLVKTDGNYMYLATGGYLIVFDASPGSETHEIGRVDIEGYVTEMFLSGDKALVFSRIYSDQLRSGVWPEVARDELYWLISKLTVVDLTNRAEPAVIREVFVEGEVASSRMIDGAARIVFSVDKPGPELEYYIDWYQYENDEERQAALEDLKAQNRAIIESTGLEAWLPRYFNILHNDSGEEASAGQLADCEDHYRPEKPMGTAILSVMTILMDDPTARQVDISVIADGYIVYASQGNLYVAGTVDAAWEWESESGEFDDTSPIHRFDIASRPDEAVYVGTAYVPGWMVNQFSMSEWEGHLRVAVTYGGWRTSTPQRNGIFVYELNDEGLAEVGSLEDLALEEQIYAARMIGPHGYLVTFLQTDPLFTVDLSNPEHPTMAGELQVPGFSTYLQPMDDNHLLAIGQGGDDWGADGTLVVSLFDVSDFAAPQLAWQYNFGWAYSEAAYDHHAFLYDGSRNLLAIPLVRYGYGDDDDTWIDDDTWSDDDTVVPDKADDDTVDDDDTGGGGEEGNFAGVVVLNVSLASGFSELAEIDHSGIQPAAGSDPYYDLPQPRRTVRIGDYLYTISDVGLVVTEIGTWENDQEISLPWEQEDYWDGGYEDDDVSEPPADGD
ncbi:MAG: hypothetical protein GX444_12850 [Myxococcales bacterium]|nr:hypothetical protein [Myxococcales bacterium]